MLKHLFDCRDRQSGSTCSLSFSISGLFFEHEPEVGSRRIRLYPDLSDIDIEHAKDICRQMHKTVASIPSLGPCSILVVWARPNMHTLFPTFEILHVHAEQFSDTQASFFE